MVKYLSLFFLVELIALPLSRALLVDFKKIIIRYLHKCFYLVQVYYFVVKTGGRLGTSWKSARMQE